MANYEVDPKVLEPLVPRGTLLDFFEGRCFVSMVGFQFLDTRVLGISVPFHRDFQEVNLRFYVKRELPAETRRGVVFVKEIVPRRALAWIANALYGEKYVALGMSHHDDVAGPSRTLAYRWQHGVGSELSVTLDGDAYLPDEASHEAFITEHYWGYARQRDGSTVEYQVEHPRWHVWRARDAKLTCDVSTLYGAPFAPHFEVAATTCFVARGSEVLVRRGVSL